MIVVPRTCLLLLLVPLLGCASQMQCAQQAAQSGVEKVHEEQATKEEEPRKKRRYQPSRIVRDYESVSKPRETRLRQHL
jgi:hypothetical protein